MCTPTKPEYSINGTAPAQPILNAARVYSASSVITMAAICPPVAPITR